MCHDNSSGQLYTSMHVIFVETSFPYSSVHSESTDLNSDCLHTREQVYHYLLSSFPLLPSTITSFTQFVTFYQWSLPSLVSSYSHLDGHSSSLVSSSHLGVFIFSPIFVPSLGEHPSTLSLVSSLLESIPSELLVDLPTVAPTTLLSGPTHPTITNFKKWSIRLMIHLILHSPQKQVILAEPPNFSDVRGIIQWDATMSNEFQALFK